MSTILRKVLLSSSSTSVISPSYLFTNISRTISTTKLNQFKEIKINEDGDNIVVEAIPIESDRKDSLIPNAPKTGIEFGHDKNCTSCPLCRLNLKRLNFSDVLILNQFIESNGQLMPQPITGLCTGSYRKIRKLVQQAQSAQLLPRPPNYECYGPWDNLNHYYEFNKRKRDRPMNVIRKEYWK